MIRADQVSVSTFEVSGQPCGWAVTINHAQQTQRPFVAAVDMTRTDAHIKSTVAHTKCEIVALLLKSDAVLRNAYETLAALERLRDAVRTELLPPNEAVMDAEDAATQLIKAIKEGT